MDKMIAFFNELAPHWDEMCNHNIDKLKTILKLVGIKENADILDVGCGTGILEEYLLMYNPNSIVAVDLSPQMIEKAKLKYTSNKITFRCIDIMNIKDEQYDIIIIYCAFPHFLEPEKLMAHVKTLLKTKGKLIICHGQSKEEINTHHHKKAAHVSNLLLPAKDVGSMLEKHLTLQIIVDTEDFYIVSGQK